MQTIIHDHLSLRKRRSRCLPHKLTDEQKDCRLDIGRFMIEKFDVGETLLYSYNPEKMSLCAQHAEPNGCNVFFCYTSHIATVVLENKKNS